MTGFVHVFVMMIAAAPVSMADTRALIEQALDEPAAIMLDNIRLGDAIRALTEQTGVKIVMPPEAMGLVPHGADTLVQKVEIANLPLRRGLTELFSPLGMTFAVRDDHVEIIPKDALRCLGRAPSWAELDVLAQLSAVEPGTDEAALAELQTWLQFQVPVRGAWNILSDAIRNVGGGPGDAVLSTACGHLGWAWCPSDKWLVVTPMQEQIRQRLQRRVSLRMNDRPLIDILHALGERVNVAVRAEPGALASLPDYMRLKFGMNVHQLPAEQVHEKNAEATSLGFLLEPDGVLFYSAGSAGPGPGAMGAARQGPTSVSLSDPYVAKMVVPLGNGKSIEWLIRLSELPEDLRQMRERDLAELFEAARRRLREAQP